MALVVDDNSYVDSTEADAYFTDRYGSESWFALTAASKDSCLISACAVLDMYCVWSGEKTDPAQLLEFPRNGDTEVSKDIKDAQCEIALAVIANGGPVALPSNALVRLKADTAELQWHDSASTSQPLYNPLVTGYLKPYCSANITGSGSAGVVRV